ncbi:hypothetical protein H4219_004060 [Mycoemilia scoparia]|uniref:Thioredoxin domain-containing protein n=1 Tax=Mycoemilia scoparia TaxID=417184 RepID=A0A9W7ZZG6_9FUNG|nr:hypothetical protein H4219_004060 [Mycoemilia scoparia]
MEIYDATVPSVLLFASLTALPGVNASTSENSKALNRDNYEDSTKTGNWIIKYTSDDCKNCLELNSAWTRISEQYSKSFGESQIYFGEINCSDQSDLCKSNGIETTSLPTLEWIRLGQKLDTKENLYEEDTIRNYVTNIKRNTQPDDFSKLGNSIILGQDNFTQAAHENIWLIKNYSPRCPHCKKMAPHWTQMTNDLAAKVAPLRIYFGEIDCIKYYDLCEKNKVEAYPTVQLWRNGVYVEEYMEDYEVEPMSKYVLGLAKRFNIPDTLLQEHKDAKEIPDDVKPPQNPEHQVAAHAPEEPVWNPDGKVIDLTSLDFKEKTNEGPWFVKFYAPWCPHCQQLAPIWEKLAETVKGKVNIAKVNCDNEGNLCQDNKIMGYPTLKFFMNGKITPFGKDQRTVKNFQEFIAKTMADSSVGSAQIKLELSNFMQLKKDNAQKVMFVLYTPKDADSSKKLQTSVKYVAQKAQLFRYLYITEDEYVLKNVEGSGNPNLPHLAVIKDGEAKLYSGSFDKLDQIQQWLSDEQYPLVEEISQENSNDLLNSNYLVLAAIDPTSSKSQMNEELIRSLKTVAKNFKTEYVESRHSYKSNFVRFAWIDTQKWSGYLERVFNFKSSGKYPAVVITKASENKFYDTDSSGKPIPLTADGIYGAMVDAIDGNSEAKYTAGPLIATLNQLKEKAGQFRKVAGRHPMYSIFFIGSIIALVLYLTRRRDGRASVLLPLHGNHPSDLVKGD